MYAKINGLQVVQYPYSEAQLRADNPNTSLPASLSDDSLANYNMARVVVTGQPDHDRMVQSVDELLPAYSNERSRWEQRWTVRPATPEEIASRQQALQNEIVSATQARLDDFARTRNYDNILSACTYATSTVPKFATEGQYCVMSRDQTWATLYQYLADVQAGSKPVPDGFADVEPLLPALTWPN